MRVGREGPSHPDKCDRCTPKTWQLGANSLNDAPQTPSLTRIDAHQGPTNATTVRHSCWLPSFTMLILLSTALVPDPKQAQEASYRMGHANHIEHVVEP